MADNHTHPRFPDTPEYDTFEILVKRDEETGGDLEVTTMRMVAEGKRPDAQVFGVLEDSVINERNKNRSRQTTRTFDTGNIHERVSKETGDQGTVVTVSSKRVDISGGVTPPALGSHLWLSSKIDALDTVHGRQETRQVDSWPLLETVRPDDPDAQGFRTVEYSQIVAIDAPLPTPTAQLMRVQRQQISKHQSVLTYKKKTDPWETFTDYEFEPETGKLVTVTRQILTIDPGPSESAQPARIETVRRIDQFRWLRVRRQLHETILDTGTAWNATPTSGGLYTEWHAAEHYFPSILFPGSIAGLAMGGTSILMIGTTSDQTLNVPHRFDITYHKKPQTPDYANLFQFYTVDVNFRASPLGFSLSNIITDPFTLYFRLGYISGQTSFAGSVPTASEMFPGQAYGPGTFHMIADQTERWKFNLWRRTKVHMRMANLVGGSFGTAIGYA